MRATRSRSRAHPGAKLEKLEAFITSPYDSSLAYSLIRSPGAGRPNRFQVWTLHLRAVWARHRVGESPQGGISCPSISNPSTSRSSSSPAPRAASAWPPRSPPPSRGAKVVLAARSERDARRDLPADQVRRRRRRSPWSPTSPTASRSTASPRRRSRTSAASTPGSTTPASSIYGRLDEVSEEDSRRLFDTNFWGVVNGSLAALPHLKANGGALINVGSEVSEAVVPAAGHVLGVEARGQGVHRRAAGRDRGGRQGPGLDHADPADGRRHALPAARARTTWTEEPKLPDAADRPGAGGRRHPRGRREAERDVKVGAMSCSTPPWRRSRRASATRPPPSRWTASTTTSRRGIPRARSTRPAKAGGSGQTHGSGGVEKEGDLEKAGSQRRREELGEVSFGRRRGARGPRRLLVLRQSRSDAFS